ncbi:MAG TPA: heterodisulfide reductase-related iron-sulfur binding cluster [Roseiflexaceae bacterium]|nr:heterodisulfide reductase-related iron-sulfur binding cluster [Roseiflexaceae bacterium]
MNTAALFALFSLAAEGGQAAVFPADLTAEDAPPLRSYHGRVREGQALPETLPSWRTTMSHGLELLTSAEYRAKLDQCIHCGLCLPACPTYEVFGTEMDGPRGRIALMRAAAEGRVPAAQLQGAFATHIGRCLACRACETACPSGVQYGALYEVARAVVEHGRVAGPAERALRWLGLRQLLPHRHRLRALARLLRLYQASGLQRLVRRLAWALPRHLRAMEAILPPIGPAHPPLGQVAPAIGARRGRVALFAGCVQDAFLPHVNAATVRVLQRNGYEVMAPPAQTCCGAAQLHAGDEAFARDLARRNVDAFLSADVDAVVVNAGGCGLSLKEYPHLLRADPVYAPRAAHLAARVSDLAEFLAAAPLVPPRGLVRARALYADSCHLRHGQRVVRQPRELLRAVPGLELVELRQPDRCCGSAGVYNIAQPDTADQILDAKMADVAASGADLIVTANAGCHMQYLYGVRRAGLCARVLHLAEVLDKAYEG